MQLTPIQKNAAAWAAIIVLLAMVLWLLAPVVAPFMAAAVLAYALSPLVNWLDALCRGRLPRVWLVLLVELVFIVLLLGIALLIVPILAKELPQLREQVPVLLELVDAAVRPMMAQIGLDWSLDMATLKPVIMQYLNENFEDAAASLLASLKIGGSFALALLGSAILIPVALFYLLLDWSGFVARLLVLVPPRLRPGFDDFTQESDQVLGQYLRGQLLVMLVLAIYYSLVLSLFGLDLAVPIGVFTGLAIFVPYVGFGLGLILAALAGLLEFAVTDGPAKVAVMLLLTYGLGQVLESFILTPRLVGERIGLHPLVVIFALLAFGQLFGFVGVLIALPASAVLLVGVRRLRARYLASTLYQS